MALGQEDPDGFRVLAARHHPPNARGIALLNLQTRPGWRRSALRLGFWRRLETIVCDGESFAAERVLDQLFLREAQTLLRSRCVLVAIPRRGLLLATGGEQRADSLAAFARLVSDRHAAGPQPLTRALFWSKEGLLSTALDAPEASPQVDAVETRGRRTSSGDPDRSLR